MSMSLAPAIFISLTALYGWQNGQRGSPEKIRCHEGTYSGPPLTERWRDRGWIGYPDSGRSRPAPRMAMQEMTTGVPRSAEGAVMTDLEHFGTIVLIAFGAAIVVFAVLGGAHWLLS